MKINLRLFPALLLGASFLAIPAARPAPAAPAADKSKPVSDDFLNDTIRRKLASDAQIKGGALEVDVKGGVVTITGKLETLKLKERTEKVIKKVPGVKSVVNKIEIAHP